MGAGAAVAAVAAALFRWTRIRVRVGEIGKYSTSESSVDRGLISFCRVSLECRGIRCTLSPKLFKERIALKLVEAGFCFPAQREDRRFLPAVVLLGASYYEAEGNRFAHQYR